MRCSDCYSSVYQGPYHKLIICKDDLNIDHKGEVISSDCAPEWCPKRDMDNTQH